MKRFIPLLALALLPSTAAASVRTEPVAAPGVGVHLAAGGLRVSGAARPGPVKLTLTGERTASVAIIELAPGHTAAELGDLAGTEDPAAVEKIGRFVAGATVAPGRTYRTTITAHARDYVAVDVSDEDGPRVTFTASGDASTAVAPKADARITITDTGFKAPSVLPADGVIRVDHAGRDAHQALALRIPADVSTAEAIRRVKRGRVGQAGTRTDLVGLVSAGTTNRVQVHLRRGRYLIVSIGGGEPLIATTRVR